MLDAGARTIHVDVMDGHFVPPISMGALVVDALAEQIHEAGALVDVHLMVERPERHIDDFAKAGADHITIHAEATPHVHYALQAVRAAGCTAGLALCPAHAGGGRLRAGRRPRPAAVHDRQPRLGRPGVPAVLARQARAAARAARARAWRSRSTAGSTSATAGPCAAAGATAFVAGSAVFGAPDPGSAYREIAAAALPGSG